jgi:capsular exopolysaccharide synthesis family protein
VPSQGPLTLADVLGILQRRVTLILGVAAAVLAGGAVAIARIPDVFDARSVVHIEGANLPESYRKTGSLAPKLSQLIGILRQEVLSRDELRDLINEMGLYEGGVPAAGAAPADAGWLARFRYVDPIERARKDIRIDITKRFEQEFVELSVQARRGDLAAKTVNRIADLLSSKNRELRLGQERDAKAFIEAQLIPTQRRLQDAEASLLRFRDANMESLPESASDLLDRISKLKFENEERREKVARTQKELGEVNARITAIVEGGRPVGPTPERTALQQELAKARDEEAELLARGYGDKMPALVKVRGRIARLKKQIEGGDGGVDAARAPDPAPGATTATASIFAELKRRQAAPESYAQVEALLGRIAELNDSLEALSRELEIGSAQMNRLDMIRSSLGATRTKLEKLQEAHDEASREHKGLLGDLREIEKLIAAEEGGRTDQFRTIEAAETPLVPVAPNRVVLLAGALLAGLGAGFGVAYLLEMLVRSYRRRAEVEADLGLPVLAVLPDMPERERVFTAAGLTDAAPEEAPRATERMGLYVAGELSRLRHAIRHQPQLGEVRTVLVTSAVTGEGKTTLVSGLGRAFARSLDHWALVIEGDLRRPALAERFELPPSPGLAGHICDGIPLAEAIQPTKYGKLSVLAAGRPSIEAADVIASSHMRRIISEMRDRYPDRYVIVDAPPVLATPEAISLSVMVDGVILVVRAGRTARASARQALKLLPREKVIGVVLNGAEIGRGGLETYTYYHPYEPTPTGEPRG